MNLEQKIKEKLKSTLYENTFERVKERLQANYKITMGNNFPIDEEVFCKIMGQTLEDNSYGMIAEDFSFAQISKTDTPEYHGLETELYGPLARIEQDCEELESDPSKIIRKQVTPLRNLYVKRGVEASPIDAGAAYTALLHQSNKLTRKFDLPNEGVADILSKALDETTDYRVVSAIAEFATAYCLMGAEE